MTNDIFTIALKLHALGFSVIPSGGGDKGKAPLVVWEPYQTKAPDENQLETWERELEPLLWGIVTGNGTGVFDIDKPEAKALFDKAGLSPHIKTPHGYHYYFSYSGKKRNFAMKYAELPGLDFRGDGGFVNVVGKNPVTGSEYIVEILPTQDTIYPWDRLPVEIRNAVEGKKPKTLTDRILQEALSRAQPGNRNDTGLWLACQLRDNSTSQAEAEAIMRQYAAQVGNTGTEPYTESEAIASLEQAYKQPAREPWHTKQPDLDEYRYTLTDSGNAERLADLFGDIVHYVREWKQYIVYNGKIWESDISGARMMAFAKQTARSLYKEASKEDDDDHRIALAKHARFSEGDQRRKAMISCFMAEPGVEISARQLDTDPLLLNCLNGTIDLRAGQLRAHNKADFITQIVPVKYNPEARSDFWDTFLQQIFDSKQELIDYIQRAIGFSATGSQAELVMFFNWGTGWNGKSTLLGVIQDVLGQDYTAEIEPEVFMVQKFGKGTGPDEGAAMLYKKRFVRSSETHESQKLSVDLIKRMTGGENLDCHRKWQHIFSYRPTHKLWLSGNHEPVITDTTDSIWLRLKKIPYTVTFTAEKRNPNLRDELLKGHREAILAWIVRGCLEWQRIGLAEPEVVTTATNQYRQEQDILADFLAECCVLQYSATITVADCYKEYKQWCEDNETYYIHKNTFNKRLEEKGLTKARGTGNKMTWHGIRLLSEDEKLLAEKAKENKEKTAENAPKEGVEEKEVSYGENPQKVTNQIGKVTSFTKNALLRSKGISIGKEYGNQVKEVTKVTSPADVEGTVFFEDSVDTEAFFGKPCPTCGGTKFWMRADGARVCSLCHPKPEGKKRQ